MDSRYEFDPITTGPSQFLAGPEVFPYLLELSPAVRDRGHSQGLDILHDKEYVYGQVLVLFTEDFLDAQVSPEVQRSRSCLVAVKDSLGNIEYSSK